MGPKFSNLKNIHGFNLIKIAIIIRTVVEKNNINYAINFGHAKR